MKMAESNQLHWLDYVVFALVMLLTSSIGLFFALTGGRQRTTKEYFSGNRNLSVFATSLSIVVSFMSAIMIIGIPAEAYLYGGQYFLACIGTGIGTLIGAFIFVPIFYPLRLISCNKYLELRYRSKLPKYFATIQSTLIGVVYSGVVIYAPCTAISSLMGFPVWAVILLSSAIAIFYTSIGGIKAVIWTDAFLCFCMLAGMLMVSIQGIRYAGGFAEAWELSVQGGRLNVFNFNPDLAARLTVWNLLIGVGFDSTGTYGYSQSAVVRYSNVQSLRKAKLTVFMSYIGNIFMYLLPVVAGLAIYAYYAKIGCDPLAANIISGPNELVTHFVMETLNYPGVPGLFIASLSAGALSSVSSSLNSAAGNLWDDILQHILPKSAVKRGALVSKLVVVLLGCISTLLCFIAVFFSGTVFQLSYSVAGVILVPMNGMFVLGVACPWINAKGTIVGGCVAFAVMLWICMGQMFHETYTSLILPTNTSNCEVLNQTTSSVPAWITTTAIFDGVSSNTTAHVPTEESGGSFLTWLYSISYLWYRTLGVTIMLIVATIVSLITGKNEVSETDADLLIPCYKSFALQTKKIEDTDSWTKDEFYSVKKKDPEEATSFI